MVRVLLIIDVQKSAVTKPKIAKEIEKIQYDYDIVYVSKYTKTDSPLLRFLDWSGYTDERLAFAPKDDAIIYTKSGYTAFIPEMKKFDEIYICGFDTDACVYKTAMDLIENNIRPIILQNLCFSATQELHDKATEIMKRNIGIKNII